MHGLNTSHNPTPVYQEDAGAQDLLADSLGQQQLLLDQHYSHHTYSQALSTENRVRSCTELHLYCRSTAHNCLAVPCLGGWRKSSSSTSLWCIVSKHDRSCNRIYPCPPCIYCKGWYSVAFSWVHLLYGSLPCQLPHVLNIRTDFFWYVFWMNAMTMSLQW